MKKKLIALFLVLVLLAPMGFAASKKSSSYKSTKPKTQYVKGYTKKDGTYVQGHLRSKK